MDGSRARARADLSRGGVIGVEAAALLSAHLPALRAVALESQRLRQQRLAARRVDRVCAYAVETLQRMLAGNVGCDRRQRRLVAARRQQLVLEALGVREQEAVAGEPALHTMSAQPVIPERQRLIR